MLVDDLINLKNVAKENFKKAVDTELFSPAIIAELRKAAIGGATRYTTRIEDCTALSYNESWVLKYIYDTYKVCIIAELGIGTKVEYIWGDDAISSSYSRIDHVR